MKTTLLFVLIMLCTLFVQAQPPAAVINYSTISSGDWADPTTWRATDRRGNVIPGSYPAPNGNNIVTINHDVNLNINYDVSGQDGFLTIGASGSLTDPGQRVLTIGDQQGSPQDRFVVDYRVAGYSIDLSKIEFYKASGIINGRVRTRSCAGFGNNSDITIGGSLEILGNLLIRQGNSSVTFYGGLRGTVSVYGIIDGPPGVVKQFDLARFAIGGNTFDCDAIAPLPVELSSFEATFGNNRVNLRWITASEKNSASFTVERSLDGKNYETATTVRAAGYSSTRREYTATDRGMSRGINYYRLKQTDTDGTFTYTQVIPVQVGAIEQELNAYSDNGNLNIVMQTSGQLQTLRVMDSMGRVIYTENPTNTTTGAVTRTIPMTGTSNRQIYIVQAVTSDGVMNKKFSVAQ